MLVLHFHDVTMNISSKAVYISFKVFCILNSFMHSLGFEPMILALLAPCFCLNYWYAINQWCLLNQPSLLVLLIVSTTF